MTTKRLYSHENNVKSQRNYPMDLCFCYTLPAFDDTLSCD